MFVISDKELELLSEYGLSYEARTLYLLFIRPSGRNGKAVLKDLEELGDKMRVPDRWSRINKSRSLVGDELQDVLFELLNRGLIERKNGTAGRFQDGETVFLPAAERSRKIWLCR